MGRQRIIKRGTTEYFQGFRINSAYDLNESSLKELIKTLQQAVRTYGTVTAVRMDFSLKKAPQDQHIGKSNEEIQECFQAFLNRLNKADLDMMMNWKLERSSAKGLHIHTVFYFNYEQVNTFTTKSQTFKRFKHEWKRQTDDNGNINICTSSLAKDDNSFCVRDNGNYPYTILSNTEEKLTTSEYNKQKNRLDKKAGFIHWISYLAKTSQEASDKRKRAGKRLYNLEDPLPFGCANPYPVQPS